MQRFAEGTGPGAEADPNAAPSRDRRLTSDSLLQGHRRIEIEHNGEIYRLQLTRQGKLILTK